MQRKQGNGFLGGRIGFARLEVESWQAKCIIFAEDAGSFYLMSDSGLPYQRRGMNGFTGTLRGQGQSVSFANRANGIRCQRNNPLTFNQKHGKRFPKKMFANTRQPSKMAAQTKL